MADFTPEQEREIETAMAPHCPRLRVWFGYRHLPEHLQMVSKPFHTMAYSICRRALAGRVTGPPISMDDTADALKALWNSKNSAVVALIQ